MLLDPQLMFPLAAQHGTPEPASVVHIGNYRLPMVELPQNGSQAYWWCQRQGSGDMEVCGLVAEDSGEGDGGKIFIEVTAYPVPDGIGLEDGIMGATPPVSDCIEVTGNDPFIARMGEWTLPAALFAGIAPGDLFVIGFKRTGDTSVPGSVYLGAMKAEAA